MEVPGEAGAPPSSPPPGGWMPHSRPGGAVWVPYALAALLVFGSFLPAPLGDAWAGAAERIVGSNWLDRPAVERAIGRLPGATALRAALLGPEGQTSPPGAPASAGVPGAAVGAAAGRDGSGGGTEQDGRTLPAIGPVGGDIPGQGGAPAGGTGRQDGVDPDGQAAGEETGGGSAPPGGAWGDGGGVAPGADGATGASSTVGPDGSPGGAAGGDGVDGAATGSGSGRDWEPAWMWPVEGQVSEPFGWRLEDGGNPRFHEGIDIDAAAGTGVRAAADGIVLRVWHDPAGLGWTVEVDHRGGWVARYAGVDHVVVRDRDVVRRGQVLAAVAGEAEGRGSHLHFELRRYGQAVDPALHLPSRDGDG